MLSAHDFIPHICRIILQSDCIAVNIDFRLAPEAKAPKGIMDVYAATKWVIKNAADLGVDLTKICLMGESGGGYVSTGACMKMI